MIKTRVIALALGVATMMMGAGYAAWTDTLTINNTIGTGELDVQFTDPNWSSVELTASDYVVLEDVDRSPKTVSFTLNNLYPGANYRTLTEMKNTGTIPAKFDKATIMFSGDQILKDNIKVNFNCWVFDPNGVHIDTIIPSQSNIPLSSLETVLENTLAGVQLEPGAYITLEGESIDQLMTFTLDPTVGNEAEQKSLSFTIAVDWKQHNM